MHKIGMCGQTTHHYITKLEIGYRAGCLSLTNYLYRKFSIKLPKGLIDIKHFRWGLTGAGTKSKLKFLLCLLTGPTTLFTQF